MNYETWCLQSKEIIAEADKYNAWRKRAKRHLFLNIAPRLAHLNYSGYRGCGFHYSLEQTFAGLIKAMALPWQPSANHCNKVEDDRNANMTTEIIYELLLEDVRKAGRGVKSYQKVFGKKGKNRD